MRYFLKIADNIDVLPLMLALQTKSNLWNQNTLRTTHINTPHAEVDDIWLRFNDLREVETVLDQHESVNYQGMLELPQARPLIFGLMARVEGERLGRCLITRLKPGGKILPHVDSGDHAAYFERFHIVLQSQPGCVFRAGDEVMQMRTGEVWWFNNQETHEVLNNSSDDRIHMIVDIKTSKMQ